MWNYGKHNHNSSNLGDKSKHISRFVYIVINDISYHRDPGEDGSRAICGEVYAIGSDMAYAAGHSNEYCIIVYMYERNANAKGYAAKTYVHVKRSPILSSSLVLHL